VKSIYDGPSLPCNNSVHVILSFTFLMKLIPTKNKPQNGFRAMAYEKINEAVGICFLHWFQRQNQLNEDSIIFVIKLWNPNRFQRTADYVYKAKTVIYQ